MDYEKISTELIDIGVLYGPKLVSAVLVWIVGFWVVKGILLALSKALDKAQVGESLKPFIKGLSQALLNVLLAITVLSMVGIEMTSFVLY
ncbi:hypothetical protein A9Q98_08190 [Thalassotalea sp. 42_200_T64]|nr:hypothetical protein A9Q98_08190 [Thalassotalea sp. 42_200_T64]